MQNKDITKIVLKILISIILFVNIVIFFLTIAILLIDWKWFIMIIYFLLFWLAIMSWYNYKQKIDEKNQN